MASPIELRARSGGLTLTGTLHRPDEEAVATLLMVPGSGPADRDNDAYFPAIRSGLLARGIAAASFDKRGVGGSSGDWRETGPAQQTADVAAQLTALRASVDPATLGLFGHSQGAWVVLEAAAVDHAVAFVVTNSGPGVTWARQGRFAVGARLAADGAAPEVVARAVARYDEVAALVRGGADLETVRAAALELAAEEDAGPADAAELVLVRAWLDHDPRPALERITCPLLALFGGNDLVVPVEESVAVLRSAREARPGGLDVAILPDANHRLQVGDPPALHPAYAATLGDWIARRVGRGSELPDPDDVAAYDEALARITLGAPQPLAGPIEIRDYDPAWPAQYEREEVRIRSILGDRMIRIEHAGSTAVPGLPAKPIVDIVLEVPDSAAEPAYVPELEAAGYVLRIREPEWFEHRVLKGPDTNINLHVFTAGCPEVGRMLLFRDRLRADAADRELYATAKRELAAREWKYTQQYADAKTSVVRAIVSRAEAAAGR